MVNVRNDGAVNSGENAASSVISDAGTGGVPSGSISGSPFHDRRRARPAGVRAGHHGQRAASARPADPERRHPPDHHPRHGRLARLGEPLVRYRGQYCYVAALLPGHRQPTPILRLRYLGSAGEWAIGIYKASAGQYSENELPGSFAGAAGTPEQGIDETFALYAGPSTGS